MYSQTENGELQLLTEEILDFSGGALTHSAIEEMKNSYIVKRYALIGRLLSFRLHDILEHESYNV